MVKIGLIGTGTIGSGVIHIFKHNYDKLSDFSTEPIVLDTICDLDFSKTTEDLSLFTLTNQWREVVAKPDIDIVVELIGGEEPAKTIIKTALQNKKSVVTANKLVLAKHGPELLELARINGVFLLYEAAVAGAIPIIKTLHSTLVPNHILGIYGIMNGTTNYILTNMQEKGIGFDEALKDAQKLGYAESDPASDVNGLDSQYKLAILASIAFQTEISPKDILVEGITNISGIDIDYVKEFHSVIKLLGIARLVNNELELRVHPVILPSSHPLASVHGVFNAVYVVGDAVGDIMLFGRGAGSVPTASSVWADVLEIANHSAYMPAKLKSIVLRKKEAIQSEYYFRLSVHDQPGVLAEISGIFAKNKISIKSAIQKGLNETAELVIITHQVSENNKNKAIEEMQCCACVSEIAAVIRVGI